MPTQEPGDGLFEGAFAGPSAFAQLVRDALVYAAREGWGEMVWSDATFEDWPLREKEVVDSLQAWIGGGRRLVMLARRYDVVQRYQPRFVSWRNRWDHRIECRVCKSHEASELPSVLWSPRWAMHRLDPVRCTGVASREVQSRVLLQQELDEYRRQSSPGFSVTTLGL